MNAFSQSVRSACHMLTVAVAVLCLMASTTASAAVFTWSGGGANATWSTTANWTGGTAPTTGNSLLFNNNTKLANVNNIGSLSIDTLTFGNSAGAFTISGSAINLGSITNSSANNQTLSLAVNQTTSGTYDASSNITLSGSLTGSGSITKTGVGSLILSGNKQSGFAGSIDVSAGTLSFQSNASLAGGSVKLGAGTTLASNASTTSLKSLELAGTGITLPSSGVTFSFNSGTFSNTSGSAYTIGNAVNFLNSSSLNVGAGMLINGSLGGGGTLAKTGTGTLELGSSSNSFSGTLNLNQGRLKLDGGLSSAAVAAAAGTDVTTNASTTSFQVNSLIFSAGAASSLTPGGTGGIGGLSSSTDITLSANTNVNFDIQGLGDGTAGSPLSEYDAVTFAVLGSGTMNYAGFLNLNFLGSNTFDNDTIFQLIDNSGYGSFAGNLDGINTTTTDASSPYAGLTFTPYSALTRDEDDFLAARYGFQAGDWISTWNSDNQRLIFSQSSGTLTVVPEPSTIVFAGIGIAMFGWSTWTRRRAKARRQSIEAALA